MTMWRVEGGSVACLLCFAHSDTLGASVRLRITSSKKRAPVVVMNDERPHAGLDLLNRLVGLAGVAAARERLVFRLAEKVVERAHARPPRMRRNECARPL